MNLARRTLDPIPPPNVAAQLSAWLNRYASALIRRDRNDLDNCRRRLRSMGLAVERIGTDDDGGTRA